MRLAMVIYYIKFPTGAWGNYFAKVRNFHLQKTLAVVITFSDNLLSHLLRAVYIHNSRYTY